MGEEAIIREGTVARVYSFWGHERSFGLQVVDYPERGTWETDVMRLGLTENESRP
jgi:hypothetical protein